LGVAYQKITAAYHVPHRAELLADTAVKRFGSGNFGLTTCVAITCLFKELGPQEIAGYTTSSRVVA